MRWALGTLLALFSLSGGAASAQIKDRFLTGVFASDQTTCDALKSGGDWEGSVLTAEQLIGYEYHCDFVDVKELAGDGGWFVSAICEIPEDYYPDVASIVPKGPDQLHVKFMSDEVHALYGTDGEEPSSDEAPDVDDSIYVYCDGVAKDAIR